MFWFLNPELPEFRFFQNLGYYNHHHEMIKPSSNRPPATRKERAPAPGSKHPSRDTCKSTGRSTRKAGTLLGHERRAERPLAQVGIRILPGSWSLFSLPLLVCYLHAWCSFSSFILLSSHHIVVALRDLEIMEPRVHASARQFMLSTDHHPVSPRRQIAEFMHLEPVQFLQLASDFFLKRNLPLIICAQAAMHNSGGRALICRLGGRGDRYKPC